MPFHALAAALLVLLSPLGAVAAADSAKPIRDAVIPHSVIPVYDDEPYDNGHEGDERTVPDDDDRDFNLYDDGEDDEDSSAQRPEDDEDSWDIDELNRSERA